MTAHPRLRDNLTITAITLFIIAMLMVIGTLVYVSYNSHQSSADQAKTDKTLTTLAQRNHAIQVTDAAAVASLGVDAKYLYAALGVICDKDGCTLPPLPPDIQPKK